MEIIKMTKIDKLINESCLDGVDLIIKSKIKSAVPELSVAGEVPDALNKKVHEILQEASKRAKANGRRTLQARDL